MGALDIIDVAVTQPFGTVLVVEDEVLIRMDVADYLRDNGFQVVEAANAAEAVAVLSSTTTVDLVFTDVQMPGAMDGLGLARWIRQHRPGLPIVVTSGRLRSDELTDELAELGPVEQKPYSEWVLLARIRRLLDLDPAD